MNRHQKNLSAFVAVLLLIFAMSLTAFAAGGSTTLTITVPCTVTLQVGDHGKVTVSNADYTGNTSFTADVGSAFTYTFTPNTLYQVDKVIYNGTDVTDELAGSTYTAPALAGNAALSVSFRFIIGGGTDSYTVTFHANGHGTAPSSQTVLSGYKAAVPTAPTASGWTFGGWYKDSACTETQKYDFNTPVKANLDLYAKWTKDGGGEILTTYTVAFNANGGSSIAAISRASGTNIDLNSYIPTREGYTFEGWYADAGLTNKITSIKLDGNITVYAKWKVETPNTDVVHLPFTDVKETDWSYEDIAYVYEKGLMQGTSETAFAPKVTTTRGMIVTIFYRLAGKPAVSGSCTFTDVSSDSYYEKAITWAAANGIVAGYGDSKFGPDDPITREQMATILYRYADYMKYDVSARANLAGFTDTEEISSYAKESLAWANASGLVNGVSDTELDPLGLAKREQVAAILHRFCKEFDK